MTGDEIVKYLNPAIIRILNAEYATITGAIALEKLLGITDYSDYYNGIVNREPMSEELKKLLVMLASPHGKTILKMYRIRKGLE